MLAQPTSVMSGPFSSFRSAYGTVETNICGDNARQPHQYRKKLDQDTSCRFSHMNANPDASVPPSRPIQRRSSVNSVNSYSTQSSPATTHSTFDSPLMPDAPGTPSSSPESASAAIPPKAFQSPIRLLGTMTNHLTMNQPIQSQTSTAPTQPLNQPARNFRSLKVDMKVPAMLNTVSANLNGAAAHPFSAPTSPLREAPKTGRRKPTNLTIRTPGFNELTFGKPLGTGVVPPTPSQKLSILQPLPSPSLPSLISPTAGPPGGMFLALPNIAQHVKNDSFSSTSGSSIGGSLPSLREEEYQPPKSQEAPERGYTEGPVLIYECGVYLYLEPTAEEASKFDTVINVAKEIKSPFETGHDHPETVMSVWRNNIADRGSVTEPQTATSEVSFQSAFEWPISNNPPTPMQTTARPISISLAKKPEYLHVKWDHNSEILGDLYPLCQIIDDRVAKGKKVLIHCQLGVSRSASLIIAYGLYKGYEKDFHSMYMAVKKRSRWVGPNMSLIYQLTDFRSKCVKGDYVQSANSADPAWFLTSTNHAETPNASLGLDSKSSASNHLLSGTTPRKSVTDQVVLRLDKELPPVPPYSTSSSVGSGPSHPFPVRTSSIQQRPFDAGSTVPIISNPTKRAAPRPLPLREKSHVSGEMSIPAHKPSKLPGLTFTQPSSMMDLAMQDVPTSPSLFSPRVTEFVAAPFGVTAAGDLVSSTPKRIKPPPGAFPGGREWRESLRRSRDWSGELDKLLAHDPRSPHQAEGTEAVLPNIGIIL